MKKIIGTSLGLLLVILIVSLTVRPIYAGITSPITWIKPARIPSPDDFLGTVSVAYVAGSTWILNVKVLNDATNGTDNMDARVYRIAVWFDWNKYYNTTVNVLIKHDDTYLFTVNGTMESTSIANNLFTHSYKVYVEYEITFLSGGGSVTQKKTFPPYTGSYFAVLSQQQYDSKRASENYDDFEDEVDTYVDNYAESHSLYVQAVMEADKGDKSYLEGEFSSALQHYNTALSLLNQSWVKYTTLHAEYESTELDYAKAEIKGLIANATATEVVANAIATATVVNAIAFVFFGVGFMLFGVAAIFYARRPKPA